MNGILTASQEHQGIDFFLLVLMASHGRHVACLMCLSKRLSFSI